MRVSLAGNERQLEPENIKTDFASALCYVLPDHQPCEVYSGAESKISCVRLYYQRGSEPLVSVSVRRQVSIPLDYS